MWSRSADTPGRGNRAKGNQHSATPLGNGTTEGQSLGKAVLGSAEEEKRQRGTTELCLNAVAQRPSLYSTKTKNLGAQAVGETTKWEELPTLSTNTRGRWESATADYTTVN